MAKILVIGDCYGKKGLIQNLEFDEFDQVVFIGNHTYEPGRAKDQTVHDVYNLFQNKIALANSHPEKFKIILGPEDLKLLPRHIFTVVDEHDRSQYTYTYPMSHQITRFASLFRVAYQYGDWMITYGGITEDWIRLHIKRFVKAGLGLCSDYTTIADFLNRMLWSDLGDIIIGKKYDTITGPFYTNASDILDKPLTGINQITGKFPMEQPITKGLPNAKNSVSFVNTLYTDKGVNKFLVIDTSNNKIHAVSIDDLTWSSSDNTCKLPAVPV